MTLAHGLSAALLSLSLWGTAHAQAPTLPPQLAPMTTTGLSATPVTATVTVNRAVPLLRWPDGTGTVAMLEADTEVTIVLRDGEQVRVRRDLEFGWVPADALTEAGSEADGDTQSDTETP